MTDRRGLGWTIAQAATAVAAIGLFVVIPLALPQMDRIYTVVYGAATASFVLVGLLLVHRVSGNIVGRLVLLTGILFAVGYGLSAYALAGAAEDPEWPGTAIASVVSIPIFIYPIVVAFVDIPLVFPDGRLLSPRWRWLVWFAVIATAAATISDVITPGPVGPAELPNPLAVPALETVADILDGFSSATAVIGFGGAACAVWLRYRRADAVERQQLKWLLAVAGLAAILFPAAFVLPDTVLSGNLFILASLTLAALPIAIAVAILRYRLYEIDRIVSRTIAYAVLTGVLVAAYSAIILLIQQPLGRVTGGDTIAVAVSTLAVAGLFQPVRVRVQRVVDRRFDRASFDAERTTAAFSDRLRHEVDLTAVTADLDATIRGVLAPGGLSVWLRGRDR